MKTITMRSGSDEGAKTMPHTAPARAGRSAGRGGVSGRPSARSRCPSWLVAAVLAEAEFVLWALERSYAS